MLKHLAALIALAVFLSACAGRRAYEEGRELIESGKVEDGLAHLEEAAKLEPENREYRAYYFRQRDTVLQRYLALAENARANGLLDEAEEAYRRMLALDPTNARARTGVDVVRMERSHRATVAEGEEALKKGNTQVAHAKAREVLAENSAQREAQALLRKVEGQNASMAGSPPQLSAALRKPITMEFRDATLRSVFELISKNTGMNFLFDRDVRSDLRTTLFVRNTTIEDVIRFVLVTNQLERKVLNENTLLIYPNTPAKLRDYQELVTRSFYLSNADAKQTANMIKALVKTKDMYIDEKLNLLMIRDTPDAVRMAERLVANQDLADPEVMLELEVLEVGTSLLTNLGIQWPDQASYSLVGAGGTPGTVTLPEWLNRNANLVRLTVSNPLLVLNLSKQDGRTNLLANPRVRIKNKDKAKIHIGDKVPVITTTSTATGFVSESVNYLDVGLKLEAEPLVFLENEVGIKISLEVSSIVQQIRSASGTLTYQVGTRNAATSLRLKDGETQVLAGLINDEDRRNATKIPGLGDLPVLGRLFATHSDTANKTEVILLVTPHIVRNLARSEARYEQFLSGTEAAAGAQPLVLPAALLDVPISAEPSPITQGKLPVPAAAGVAKFALRAPAQIAAGQEFVLDVSMDTETPLRGGLLDFAFDPSRLRFVRAEPGPLLADAGTDLAFRANAPENMGRLNLSFDSKADIKGAGVAARLVFQASPTAAGTPSLRLEALTVTDAGNRSVSVQLPPAVSLAVTK